MPPIKLTEREEDHVEDVIAEYIKPHHQSRLLTKDQAKQILGSIFWRVSRSRNTRVPPPITD